MMPRHWQIMERLEKGLDVALITLGDDIGLQYMYICAKACEGCRIWNGNYSGNPVFLQRRGSGWSISCGRT